MAGEFLKAKCGAGISALYASVPPYHAPLLHFLPPHPPPLLSAGAHTHGSLLALHKCNCGDLCACACACAVRVSEHNWQTPPKTGLLFGRFGFVWFVDTSRQTEVSVAVDCRQSARLCAKVKMFFEKWLRSVDYVQQFADLKPNTQLSQLNPV